MATYANDACSDWKFCLKYIKSYSRTLQNFLEKIVVTSLRKQQTFYCHYLQARQFFVKTIEKNLFPVLIYSCAIILFLKHLKLELTCLKTVDGHMLKLLTGQPPPLQNKYLYTIIYLFIAYNVPIFTRIVGLKK